MTEHILEDDEFLDVEPFEGTPDFDCPQADFYSDAQDDESSSALFSFMSTSTPVHDTRETLDWYIENQTTSQIGFNPDNMCLKVCRTARNIPAKYLSAKESQDATPEAFRVYKISDMRKGMIAYFDDPNDSNRFGHVVTQIGRVRGSDRSDLDGLLFETNSVKSGELVVVRGSYFVKHWGDSFKFGATWLNGVEFPVQTPVNRIEKFERSGPRFDLKYLDRMAKAGNRDVAIIRDLIDRQVRRLPDNPNLTRVREFKEAYRSDRELRMMVLNEAVAERPDGLVAKIRDEIRRLIENLPDE